MRGVLTQVRATLRHRRAQTSIILLVTLMASAVSTMALTLLVRSASPWDDAFAGLAGPHMVFRLDAAAVTRDQLDRTAELPGVAAASPPRETAVLPFVYRAERGSLEVIGRDDPGGSVGRVTVSTGRWPQRAGEIALVPVDEIGIHPRVGQAIDAVTAHGRVTFTVVGEVSDLTAVGALGGTPRGFVRAGQVAPLADGGQVRLGYEMSYRFRRADSAEALGAERKVIEQALPSGAETSAPNDWISMRRSSNWLVSMTEGIILAFTVLALLAVVLIVASVVAGSVVSGYRDIGIAKAIGCTPAEVTLVVLGSMAVPAVAGAILGVPLGALLSRPFLDQTAAGLKLPQASAVDPLVDLLVPIALLAVVVVVTIVPASRAAHTSAVRAIAIGSAPAGGRRSFLTLLAARLGLPRAASLGAGETFARPVRGGLTLAALAIAVATLTFSFAFRAAIQGFLNDSSAWGGAHDVNVSRSPGTRDGAVTSLLKADPATGAVVAVRQLGLKVKGKAQVQALNAMRGDITAFGYHATEGRWFAQPGEAVVAPRTMNELQLRVGDSVAGAVDGHPLHLRIVGIDNDVASGGRGFRVAWETLPGVVADPQPDTYLVRLRKGSDVAAYVDRLSAAGGDGIVVGPNLWKQWAQPSVDILTGLTGGLTLVLALVAAMGTFNASLLSVRERAHDIAVLKSVGMTPAQLSLMVATSSLLLASLSTVVGLPLGTWLVGPVLARLTGTFGFVITAQQGLTPATGVIVVVAGLVVALAGAAVPARWAARTPVGEVLRSE